MGLKDGLASGDMKAKNVIASTALSGADLKVATSKVGASEIATDFANVKLGSPAAIGNSVLMVDGTTGAGSSVWQTFEGHTFKAAPKGVAVGRANATGWFTVSGTSTGSALVLSQNASSTFTLLCIGSGR